MMMTRRITLSIRTQLFGIWVTTILFALISTTAVLALYGNRTLSEVVLGRLVVLGEVTGHNSQAALTFQDAASATETLDALRAAELVRWACLYTADGRRLAFYRRTAAGDGIPSSPPAPPGLHPASDGVLLVRAVEMDGEVIGTVAIRSDLTDIRAITAHAIVLIAASTVLSALLALMLAWRPLRGISRPIQDLAAAARRVSRERNFSVRVPERGSDEIGQLGVDFNEMLSRIQRQHEEELEAEELLRESERRLRQITENLREFTWLSDAGATQMLYVSPAYEPIWGRSCESLYASPRSWLDAVHPDDAGRVRAAFLRLGAGDAFAEEFHIVKHGVDSRLVRFRAWPIRDEQGRVYRIAGAAEDITEQRLLEDQFRQAHKMEAIGKLAGGVAHDFNNHLTVIIGHANLALGSIQPADPLREALESIIQSGTQAAALTRQLLAFSRKQILQPKVMDLNAAVRDLEKMYSRVVGEHIEFSTSLARDLDLVRADPGQVDQIIMNLVVNARDAMPEGGTLTIRTANVDLDEAYAHAHPGARPGPHVELAVSDTGCGMDEATRARIFEPFFTTKLTGTGLGLATVFGATQQSAGHIRVESAVGRGSTFHVYFPRVAIQADPPRPVEPHVAKGSVQELVLLVDDEPAVRKLAAAVLRGAGYTVLEAESPLQALAIGETHPGRIDLLLTDMVMPHMSGAELATRLRAVRPTIRVVFMSGYAHDAVAPHGALEPGIPLIEKPFTTVTFLTTVRQVLDAAPALISIL